MSVAKSRVLVLGITFKDNCPDIRTKVVDVVHELQEYRCEVSVYDPWADSEEVREEYGLELLSSIDDIGPSHSVVLAVGHREFVDINPRIFLCDLGIVYDVKSLWPKELVDKRL